MIDKTEKPVSPLYVPPEMSRTLMRDFMRPMPDDPSAFLTIQIYACADDFWKASYDAQCELTPQERAGMDELSRTFWLKQADAVSAVELAMETTGWKASGHWRVRPVALDQLPPEDLAVPIATTAASDRKDQAMERIARVNPHLARMATEVQELMLWDQYANGALGALIQVYALDQDEKSIVNMACKYADAMMEARLARAHKKPAQITAEGQEESPA